MLMLATHSLLFVIIFGPISITLHKHTDYLGTYYLGNMEFETVVYTYIQSTMYYIYFFHQITKFIKVRLVFVFGRQTL